MQDTVSKKDFKSDEVVVVGDKFDIDQSNSLKLLNSTEDILKSNNSVELIRRANFASEAMVRGYSQGQLNVTIDGMRMFSACTDKMDPITSYVEVENLKLSEVNADKSDMSNGVSVGGSINLVTQKPKFGDNFGVVLDNSYNTASKFYDVKGKLTASNDYLSSLLTYSVKRAGNYTAGNNSLVQNSGFKKENVKFNLMHRISDNATQGLEYIYDHSSDVGFPSLIMDTRRTNMDMLSYQLSFKNLTNSILKWDTRLYYNSVKHFMDDYDRSEAEIRNREVMPGMNMPMYGTTSTYGLVSKGKLLVGGNILQLSADLYKMNAFADMKMKPLDKSSEMYLINLGDIDTYSGGLSAGYYVQLDTALLMKLSGRADFTSREVKSDFAKAITQTYWSDNFSISKLSFNASAEFKYSINSEQELNTTISRVERVPTHLESFGFYTYNISDNSFYIGNPTLDKEKSYSVNLTYNYSPSIFKLNVNLFYDHIDDYIAGVITDIIPVGENFPQDFKLFENIGGAYVTGIEASISLPISDKFSAMTKVRYQYSHSAKFNESLPFTPPLSGVINLSYVNADYISSISAEFANAQHNLSKHIQNEDNTPGYVILNWRNNYSLSDMFTLRFGVENILDKYYYTHYSINNLPSLGRNFYLGLVISL